VHDSLSFTVTYIDVELTPPTFADFPITRSVTDLSYTVDFDHYTSSVVIGTLSYTALLVGGVHCLRASPLTPTPGVSEIYCPNNEDAAVYSIRITATEDLYDVVNDDELITITITSYNYSGNFVTTTIL